MGPVRLLHYQYDFMVYSRFPDSYFPGWFFPVSRFPGGHFPGWDNFLRLIYRHTPNMNNTYIFIPRQKANWLALLTPQRYAKCQMLILHHSSKTNELRNVQSSIKTASVSTFLSWPYLINYRYSVCVVLVVAACYLLQLAPRKLNRLNRSNAMTMTTAT